MAKQYAADHCQSNNQQPQETMFFGPKACRGANDGQILDNPISTLKCNQAVGNLCRQAGPLGR